MENSHMLGMQSCMLIFFLEWSTVVWRSMNHAVNHVPVSLITLLGKL